MIGTGNEEKRILFIDEKYTAHLEANLWVYLTNNLKVSLHLPALYNISSLTL